MSVERFEKQIAACMAPIQKQIQEVVIDCERRAVGADQRLSNCRGALMKLGKVCDTSVFRLLDMKNNVEQFSALPQVWQDLILMTIKELRDTQAAIKATRETEGW